MKNNKGWFFPFLLNQETTEYMKEECLLSLHFSDKYFLISPLNKKETLLLPLSKVRVPEL